MAFRQDQPVVLSIAGSDSSGGAGIQADLKTFAAFGCYGSSAITALTAQNTTGVQSVHGSPPEFVKEQIASVLNDLDVKVIKTGMLFDSNNTIAVVEALQEHYGTSMVPIICDPVCVSTSGHSLLHLDAVAIMISTLFPLSRLITPNKSEAELLLSHRMNISHPIDSLESMLSACKSLLAFGSSAVLLKGGHLEVSIADVGIFSESHPEIKSIQYGLHGANMEILRKHGLDVNVFPVVLDILCEKSGETTIFVRTRVESSSTHGTGCTLSSAIAAELARGSTLVDAVATATVYTHRAIEHAPGLGQGHGPLNHLHSLSVRLVPSPTKNFPYPLTSLLINNAYKTWKGYVEHDFVQQLGRGTLNPELFVHFLKQDYLYLRYYARAYSLLSAKASSFGEIANATKTITNILTELDTHRSMCASFGIEPSDLENTEESQATTAYGAYVISVGVQGDSSKLLMALIACLIGYGEVGLWLKSATWTKLEGNRYEQWIDDYSGENYQAAVKLGMETIERLGTNDPPSQARLDDWCQVFKRCTQFERGFWDMAIQRS